jgi:hypothetical protein
MVALLGEHAAGKIGLPEPGSNRIVKIECMF